MAYNKTNVRIKAGENVKAVLMSLNRAFPVYLVHVSSNSKSLYLSH